MLYPATPHITHALWQQLGYAKALGDLIDAPWLQPDAAALQKDEIELMPCRVPRCMRLFTGSNPCRP